MKRYLLSIEQMRAAEQAAMKQGSKSYALMHNAGQAVAEYIIKHFPHRKVMVLNGPGNNGGDGWVVAQILHSKKYQVQVFSLVERKLLKGDAARAAAAYKGRVIGLKDINFKNNAVIVDALFGIGLNRKITGKEAALIKAINEHELDVVAVDIPSGVQGNTGEILGAAFKAKVTITFAAEKYGHLLLPGRLLCGEVVIADIGITSMHITSTRPQVEENNPANWSEYFPWPKPQNHKYHRGHTLVIGGPAMHAGAARLTALAALRSG